jgi:hypothetical protein
LLKKTITYTDFNDEEVSEDFFFHLSQAELIELEMSQEGGFSEALKRIIAAEDGKSIIKEFKNIILGSYGKRSPDGKRFIKNQAIREEFESSEAYSTLFMELVTNAEAAVAFINGVIPAKMMEEARKLAVVEPPSVAQFPPGVDPQLYRMGTTKTVFKQSEVDAMSPGEKNDFIRRLAAGEVTVAE